MSLPSAIRDPFVLPEFGAILDQEHPLSRGLISGALFNAQVGASIVNIVPPDSDHWTASTALLWAKGGLQTSGATVKNSLIWNFGVASVAMGIFCTTRVASGFFGGFNDVVAGSDDKEFGLNSSLGLEWSVFDGAVKTATDPTALAAATYFDICGTADGTTSRLYKNGLQVASVAAGQTYTGYVGHNLQVGGTSTTYIASPTFTTYYFYMWNRALTAEEVQELHSSETGPYAIFLNSSVHRFYSISAAVTTKLLPLGRIIQNRVDDYHLRNY